MADKIVQLVDKNNDNIYPVASVPNAAKITMTDVDPGEGSPLAADNYIAVYGSAPLEFDYSLNEVNTGTKWIDGKAIYRKTIDFGALPNTSNKFVAHNITDLGYLIKYDGMTFDGTTYRPLIMPNASGNQWLVAEANAANVAIYTGFDASARTAYITLYYTKTS